MANLSADNAQRNAATRNLVLPLPAQSNETTFFNDKRNSYLLEWNNSSGHDTKVPLSGKMTGPIFRDLAAWREANRQLGEQNPIEYQRQAARRTHELIMQYAGPYDAETANFINNKMRPLQAAAAKAEDELFSAKQIIEDFRKTDKIAKLLEKRCYFVKRIPPLSAVDLEELPRDQAEKYKALQLQPKTSWNSEDAKYISALEQRAYDRHIETADRVRNVSLARDYLKSQSAPQADGDDAIVRQAADLAARKLDDGLRAQYESVIPRIASLEKEAILRRKQADEVSLPESLTEKLWSVAGPFDINHLDYGTLVCRHRAPLARAMLDFVGVKSEILTGAMLDSNGKIGHVTVFIPGLNEIFEPSSDSFSLTRISGKWQAASARRVEPRHAIRTEGNIGYELDYSDAVLPALGKSLTQQSAVEGLRRRASNEFHLNAITNNRGATYTTATELYSLSKGIKDDLGYLQQGISRTVATQELLDMMTPQEKATWESLSKQRDLVGKMSPPSSSRFPTTQEIQEFTRKRELEERIESLGSQAYARALSPLLSSRAQQLLNSRELSPANLSEVDLLRLAGDEAERSLRELSAQDPSGGFAITPGASLSYSGPAEVSRDWVIIRVPPLNPR